MELNSISLSDFTRLADIMLNAIISTIVLVDQHLPDAVMSANYTMNDGDFFYTETFKLECSNCG